MALAFKKDNYDRKYVNPFHKSDQEDGTARAGSPCLQKARQLMGEEHNPEPGLVITGIMGDGKKGTSSAQFTERSGGRTIVLLATPLLPACKS